jgi:hypothetical protein
MLTLALLLQAISAQPTVPPRPSEICPRTHQKLQGGPVDDSYIVIGKTPRTSVLYSGTLTVEYSQGRYLLTRKTSSSTVHGEAWAVLCGPDKVPLLQASYDTKPLTKFLCKIGVNYDNYSLANCGPASNFGQSVTGLEAWFPSPSRAP